MTLPTQNQGTYALLLRVDIDSELQIGKFKTGCFPMGGYVYVGSARGPGGLRARLAHHTRPSEITNPHWHIDWMRRSAQVEGLWWQESPIQQECKWVQELLKINQTSVPMPGFGATDCRLVIVPKLVTEENRDRKGIQKE